MADPGQSLSASLAIPFASAGDAPWWGYVIVGVIGAVIVLGMLWLVIAAGREH